MAVCSSPSSISLLSSSPIPRIVAKRSGASVRVSNQKPADSTKRDSWKLKAAGLAEIEPDLNEDPVDRWRTNGVSEDEFVYGLYDGHHTYNEADDKGDFWEDLKMEYESVDPPTGFQGLISWLFPPAIAAGMFFHAPGEYLFIGAGLFTIVFCIIEMNKPDQPYHFEPQIYNMERGARDKLLAEYNTMDVWEFNEKYGDLWDFTVRRDETFESLSAREKQK